MDTLISVIVPIYNAEKYLERCVNSIQNQTYSTLEIILVDDGSTDTSGKIADELANSDERILVIHQKNSGVSHARNMGITASGGKYISFTDADDYLHPNFIKRLFTVCKEQECEISQCNFVYTDGTDIPGTCREEKPQILNNVKMLEQLYGATYIRTAVCWNKLYLRTLFDGISFEDGRIHEDEAIVYRLFYRAERIGVIEEPLYFYCQTPDSIMHKKYTLARLDILHAIDDRRHFYKEKNLWDLYYKDNHKFLTKILDNYACVKKMEHTEKKTKILKELKREYRKVFRESLKAPWSLKRWMKLVFFGIFPALYVPLIKKGRG